MLKSELDTPALLVDLSVMERNIDRMARTFRDAGVGWRPHTKGLKVPQIAHKLLSAGAFGVTCAKVGEAEVMANAGIRDILIANQVVGEHKIGRARLERGYTFAPVARRRRGVARGAQLLRQRVADGRVVVDDENQI